MQTFGVLLYAAGRWGHLDLEHGVFTARLEVDYKKVTAHGSGLMMSLSGSSMYAGECPQTASSVEP